MCQENHPKLQVFSVKCDLVFHQLRIISPARWDRNEVTVAAAPAIVRRGILPPKNDQYDLELVSRLLR
jgi:hypothetical protein